PARHGRALAGVVLSAAAALVAADVGMRRLIEPPPVLVEAEDALSTYRHTDPDVLVIGSSHSRAFFAVADLLAERTGGAQKMLPVPLEFGKLTSYLWLLEHKLRPLIEERNRAGNLVRPSLSRVLLATEWWDACAPDRVPAVNVAARAWGWSDFLGDFVRHGLSDYNRNFLNERVRRSFPRSLLVQYRGDERILDAVHDVVRENKTSDPESVRARQIAKWRVMIERGASRPPGDEKRALEDILDYLQAHGLEVTVVLFPRMPETLTERAKQTTLKQFADYVAARARARSLRWVDMTYSTPLRAADFQADLDHVSPEGGRKFAHWAHDHDLRFLLEPVKPRRAQLP